jgi:HEAT repeat protein
MAQDRQQPMAARQAALSVIAIAKDGQSCLPLLSLLDQNEESLCDAVIHSLGQIGSRKATRRLCSLLPVSLTATQTATRANHVISALWNIGDARSAPSLARIATNPSAPQFTRGLATEALGYLKPVRRTVVTPLLRLLNDDDLWIRYSAACGLVFCGTPLARPALQTLLTDHRRLPGRPTLSELAAEALGVDQPSP